ncbi:dTDP-4-dehydrorhamnose 3,5-epimerase family protein [Shewanella sp. PP-Sp27a-2]
MIEGTLVTKLKRIPHDKGDIFHAIKCSDEGFTSFGEAYFSSVNFKDVKGWKKHTRMVLNLIVPVGSVRFVLFDDRKESLTNGKFFEVTISRDNYVRLTVPLGVWVAFQGVDDGLNLLLNIASIEHDPTESIVKNIKEIPFRW